MTSGELVTFIMYNNMLTWPTRQLGRIIGEMSKAGVSIGRLREILLAKPEEDSPQEEEPPIRGQLVFDDVSFSYGSHPVLHHVSFTVEPGETVAILGGTGSGKSTLMHLVNRLYELPPEGGSIRIDGVDVRRIRRSYLRRNVGMVLQEPFLFSRSIRQNLAIAAGEKKSKSCWPQHRPQPSTKPCWGFPRAMTPMLGERGVTLSGGQQQRLSIARTLAADPPILIFDDSLSAVDTETDSQIRKALAQREHKATTLIHLPPDHHPDGGRPHRGAGKRPCFQIGTHEQLAAQDGLYRRIFRIQSLVAEEVENETQEVQP